jgi:phage terminase large subunit GpA-like protein
VSAELVPARPTLGDRLKAVLRSTLATALARFEPPPRLTVSDWADANRVLSSESSASPGMWRTSTTPYLREIQDALGDSHTETIVFLKSAQVGATEALINALMYALDNDPGPAMYIMPTLELAGALSKDRLAPALRDCKSLADQVGDARGKDADNSILRKSIAGSVLTLSGANSPASLASRPVRFLLADEVDRFPASAGSEGDPLALAIKRTTSFRRRKILVTSTPTIKGASRIEDWWEVSDKRLWHTPCPRCSEPFVIEWQHVRWETGNVSTAHIECPACGGSIEDTERPAMMAAGFWRATAAFSGVRGYRVWEIVAPWRRLTEIVNSFLVAKNNAETLRVWVNTCRGELWEEPGERVESASLMERREKYKTEVPAGALLLTAGIDTQDDRLEALVVGWGFGEESWVISRETLPGDPAKPDVWRELDELLAREWVGEGGVCTRVQFALIDAGGHRTQSVYTNCIARAARRLFPSFGRSGGERGQIISPPKQLKTATGQSVFRRIVDVDQVKALVYSRLKITDPAEGYMHFPMSVGDAFFSELTAEQRVTRRNKYGVPERVWQQIRERNESLDCFVLAFASLRALTGTPERFARYAGHLAKSAAAPAPVAPTPAPAPTEGQQPPGPRRRVARSGYLGR